MESSPGTYVSVRPLIDQGSQASFISNRLASRLNIPREKVNIPVNGIGGSSAGNAEFIGNCVVRSRNLKHVLPVNPLIIEEITNLLPSCSFDNQALNHLKGIVLADPNYQLNNDIDLLLDADVYG